MDESEAALLASVGAADGAVKPISQVAGSKAPPPEDPDAIKTRRWILASFWSIVILVGLPVWVWTTTVPRAPLPLESMNKWADGHACQIELPIHVAVDWPAARSQDTQQLVRLLQQTVDDHHFSSLHHLRISAAGQLDRSPAVTVKLFSEPDRRDAEVKLLRYEPILEVRHTPLQPSAHSSSLMPLVNVIAGELRNTFDEEQALLTHLLSDAGRQISNTYSSPLMAQTASQRATRAFRYASTYHLTFSLFTGAASPSTWDIQTALDEHLQPLLSSFSSISNFTVDTQVQLYATLPPSMQGPTLDNRTSEWVLDKSDLSGFINAAEWPLSPAIGDGPTINFVLYIPTDKQSPLKIQGTGGTSWLIPQWGGVQILNPTTEQKKRGKLSSADLQPIVTTFADQLVSLLGLPRTPASLPIQLGSLTRERTASLILSASSTLGALSRLTLKLTSIAIPDSVATSADRTIHNLNQACESLRNASYDQALDHARIAEAEAEHAFFEPSMVGQVYFPDEHKVAVYVPLLGPVAVPLLLALIKETKKLRHG